jgi:hypothetical protein
VWFCLSHGYGGLFYPQRDRSRQGLRKVRFTLPSSKFQQSSQERTGNCHACGRRERTPLPVLGMRLGAILVGFWFASDGSNIPHARANYLTSSRNNAVKRGARLLLPQCRTRADSCGEPELGAG